MTENKFIIKGSNADEYFKITREEFLKALVDIRDEIKEYRITNKPQRTLEGITGIIKKTIGGL